MKMDAFDDVEVYACNSTASKARFKLSENCREMNYVYLFLMVQALEVIFAGLHAIYRGLTLAHAFRKLHPHRIASTDITVETKPRRHGRRDYGKRY